MNIVAPVLLAFALLTTLHLIERTIGKKYSRGPMPSVHVAVIIGLAVFAMTFVRDAWRLPDWWGLPVTVFVVGTAYLVTFLAWSRRKA